ncbi:hypothetical protein [Paraburkholderia tropica]|uniref:hypothetical protein n=1 Tax=Paraburkholderia tropica TaxID=92647 RepID=UPI0031D7A416
MSAVAFAEFESDQIAEAITVRTLGREWSPRLRSHHENLVDSFTNETTSWHAAEKARTYSIKQNVLSPKQIKLGGLHEISAHRRFPRDEAVREVFRTLSDKWRDETMFESSNSSVVLNENYQKIIGLGPKAVPWIIDDLRETGSPWFWALRMITREDPVSPADRGRIPRMIEAWLNWAKEYGI